MRSKKRGASLCQSAWLYSRLEPKNLLAAMPIITEFVASNGSSLNDDNGNSTDWIEIYNAGDEPANLGGYTLSDDFDEPTKWTFPTTTFSAGEFLIVFAGDDADPASGTDLYTGFKLSSDGEYLSLHNNSGQLLSEFGSGGADYPGQYRDRSYGVLMTWLHGLFLQMAEDSR